MEPPPPDSAVPPSFAFLEPLPLIYKRCVFTAHITSLYREEDVGLAYQCLVESLPSSSTSLLPFAYRLEPWLDESRRGREREQAPVDEECVEGCSDCGDLGCSEKLLFLLKRWNSTNVLLVVSTQQHKVIIPELLGVRKFKYVMSVAKSALEAFEAASKAAVEPPAAPLDIVTSVLSPKFAPKMRRDASGNKLFSDAQRVAPERKVLPVASKLLSAAIPTMAPPKKKNGRTNHFLSRDDEVISDDTDLIAKTHRRAPGVTKKGQQSAFAAVGAGVDAPISLDLSTVSNSANWLRNEVEAFRNATYDPSGNNGTQSSFPQQSSVPPHHRDLPSPPPGHPSVPLFDEPLHPVGDASFPADLLANFGEWQAPSGDDVSVASSIGGGGSRASLHSLSSVSATASGAPFALLQHVRPAPTLSKDQRLELKLQRAALNDVLAIFQAVLILIKGRAAKDASWFDCRDVICHPDFDLNKVDLTVIGESRLACVRKKVEGLGKTVDDVRRGSELAADVLEWLCDVCKYTVGGENFTSPSPANVPGGEFTFDYKHHGDDASVATQDKSELSERTTDVERGRRKAFKMTGE